MMKPVSITLGLGLLVLTIAGWAMAPGAAWLAWFDLVGALCAFWIAYSATAMSARVAAPVALGLGLFVLWVIAQSSVGVPMWQSWWTFAFGCAYVLLGIADYFTERGAGPHAATQV